MNLSRRDMLIGAGASVALISLGLVPKAFAQKIPVRPPGCQDESDFLAKCIRCDRCRSICPKNCIGLGKIEDGIFSARTPLMDFRRGECTFCDLCIDVCPTGIIKHINPQTEAIGKAVVVPNSCIAWPNPGSCRECEKACDYDAVVIEDGLPKVIEEKCNGCGACEYKCPALSLGTVRDMRHRGIIVASLDEFESTKQTLGNYSWGA